MKKTPVALAALAFVSVAFGLAVGYHLGRPQPEEDRRAGGAASSARENAAAPSRSASVPSVTVAASEAIGSFADPAYARLSFRERMEQALSYESHRKQAYAVELLFEDLTSEEAPEILGILMRETDSRKRRGMLRPFFLKWAKLDGEAAFASASELDGREKLDAQSAALAGWGEAEPYRAWDAAKAFLDGGNMRQSYLVRGAYQELAKRDLVAALGAFDGVADRNLLLSMNGVLVTAAFESDQVPMLLSRLDGLADAEQRKAITGQIFRRWGEEDTNAPMDALARITDADVAKEAMTGFLQGWVQSDREGAIDYAIENRSDLTFSDSLGAVINQAFFAGGEAENRELVARLSGEGLLDSIARDVVSSLSFTQPELAMELASGVSDPDDRMSFQNRALSGWANRDFDGALAYYSSVESPDQRARLAGAIVHALGRRTDGGEVLVSLVGGLPLGGERRKVVESALSAAASPRARNSASYLASLETVAAGETELSEKARKDYAKLFPKE